MSSLQLVSLRRTYATGVVWDIAFRPGMNILIGVENASKTTTLRIIDFCFGDDTSARREFGGTIAGEYQQFRLAIQIDGQEHILVRHTTARDQTTLTQVDGELKTAQEFNRWIGTELRWPDVLVPRGLSPSTTQADPLTFRGIYRHIYRRANSWTSFASNEFEHYRRAVVAFFLGVAEQLYSSTQVEITRTEAEIRTLQQREIELRALLDDIVRQASEGYRREGATSLDSIDRLLAEIDAQISETRLSRNKLAHSVQGNPRYDITQDRHLSGLNQTIRNLADEREEVTSLLGEQRRLADALDGDIHRIQRARQATSLLRSVMVTSCPACFQRIDPPDYRNGSDEHCYVCHQPIVDDPRLRRLDLEERTIGSEKAELEGVIADLGRRLEAITARGMALVTEKEALLRRLDRERQEFIAPFLQAFESVQYRLGQLDQRRESLVRLSRQREKIAQLERESRQVTVRLQELMVEAADNPVDRELLHRRAGRLAEHMNDFIDQLPTTEGIGGVVSVGSETLTFHVGRERWDNAMGNERRVLFLLAYHYGLLKLSSEEDIPFPKLVILDNPFQQDVSPDLVERGLLMLSEACAGRDDTQVIVTTRRELDSIQAHRIYFGGSYNPEPNQDEEG